MGVELWTDMHGVFIDNLAERFLKDRNTYGRLFPQSRFGGPRVSASEYLSSPAAFSDDLARYRALTPFGRNAPEGLALMAAVTDRREVRSREDIRQIYGGLQDRVEQWTSLQKEERRALAGEGSAWHDLNVPYQFFVDGFSQAASGFDAVHLVSNMEAALAREHLERLGISGQFTGVHQAHDKADYILTHAQGKAAYVEDQYTPAIESQSRGIMVAMPSWGYNTLSQRLDAQAQGVTIATPDAFVTQILALR